MKLTCEQIITYSALHNTGRTVSEGRGRYFIDECLNELAVRYDSACKVIKIEVPYSAGVWTDLPEGLIRLVKVTDTTSQELVSDYDMEYGKIRFEEDVTVELTYMKPPTGVDVITDYPDIHELYHPIIPLFVAARSKQRDYGSHEVDAQRLMNEFDLKAFNIDSKLKHADPRTFSMRK